MTEQRIPSKVTAAATRYQKEWRLGRRRLVDSGPVLAHVEKLHGAGWPLYEISLRAGLSRNSVAIMVSRRPRHVRISNARAILALRPGDLMRGRRQTGRVPSVGTVRRVQALLAMGWTYADQHAVCGVQVREVTRGSRASVTVGVHNAVADMFEALCMRPGPSEITRTRARRAGYAPPLAWDDIDDPTAVPDYGTTTSHEAPLDEWMHLVQLGVSTERALRQCGTTAPALQRAAYRHGRTDVLHHLGIDTNQETAA